MSGQSGGGLTSHAKDAVQVGRRQVSAPSAWPQCRQQRCALLKRHVEQTSSKDDADPQVGSNVRPALPEQASQAAQSISKQPEHIAPHATAATGERSAANGAASMGTLNTPQAGAAAGCSLPKKQRLTPRRASGLDAALAEQQVAGAGTTLVRSRSYAVDSDAELSDGEGRPHAISCPVMAPGGALQNCGKPSAQPDAEAQGAGPRSPMSLRGAATRPVRWAEPVQLTPAQVAAARRRAANAASTLPRHARKYPSVAPAAPEPVADVQPSAGGANGGCCLAAE